MNAPSTRTRGFRPLPLVLAALLAATALPAQADHPQQADGGPVTFDHRGGNEWWVEAVVDHGGRPDQVHARDEGDATWHALEFKDWGEWGGSFHVEPGHRVMFRSVQDGAVAESCWFTHPGGTEECDGGDGGDGGGTDPDGFDADFRTPGGNEWWVEVYVDADAPLAGVDARDDGGPWVALEKRSWGAWAKSFHVEDGSLVQFRATSTGGETDLSGEYRWPGGEQVSGEPDDGGDDGTGDTGDGSGGEPGPGAVTEGAFGPKASNEWWVETVVIADGELSRVEARADGGAWHELSLRDWGAWAASFHVPDGSVVEFRAHGADGGTIASDRFTWPDAHPVGEDPDAWPHEGAYVQYFYRETVGSRDTMEVDVVFVHAGGEWFRQCDGEENGEPVFEYGPLPPPTGPADTSVGESERPGHVYRCGHGSVGIVVEEQHTHSTHQDGDGTQVTTWYGEHVEDCRCDYDQAEWAVAWPHLSYHFHNGGTSTRTSSLLDTNAPVR